MIDAVNVPVQTVDANGTVLFANTRVFTGCSVRHEQGSGRFIALRPGVYTVAFNGNVSIPTGGTVGPIKLVLVQDGEEVAGSAMKTTPAAVATPQNISTTNLIRVYCDCCVALAVRNASTTEIALEDANVVITRES